MKRRFWIDPFCHQGEIDRFRSKAEDVIDEPIRDVSDGVAPVHIDENGTAVDRVGRFVAQLQLTTYFECP